MTIRFRRACVSIVAVVGLLAACTNPSPEESGEPSSSPTSATPSPSESSAQELIDTANLQAAQYDYDAAIATLDGEDSEEAKAALADIEEAKANAVEWSDNAAIPHLFYHSLAIDPERSFGDPSQGAGFSQYMVSISEFEKQLQQIYDNGWVMISPERIATPNDDGEMTTSPILLPPDKKPFVLSIDDVSYYEYMDNMGFANNLIVEEDGSVVNTYTDASGKEMTGNYDVMPIVDDFVEQNPDFSYRGDKGLIGLTGYNGVLGYRTSVSEYGDNETTTAQQQSAKEVADALVALGWEFASHTWGHIDLKQSSLERIKADSERWSNEVQPIVGDTLYLIDPFGADIAGVEEYSDANPKFAYLYGTQGFEYYFNVDASQQYWMQIGAQSVRQARINVDGITLQKTLNGDSNVLDEFFDAESTIDPDRPLPVPGV